MRQQMLNGQWPDECTRCQQEEEAGLNSRRGYEIQNWGLDPKSLVAGTQKDGSISEESFPLKYLDLRFGNNCNLACRMCGPTDSNAWYKDYHAITNKLSFQDSHGQVDLAIVNGKIVEKQASYNWYEQPEFWDSLKSSLDTIEHIYMAGGEPLLIRQHYDFLQDCVSQGLSAKITLEYNTNLTVLPQKVINLWQHFKQVRVGASIDGFGEVFEYQRYPAQWSRVYENLKKLDQLGSPVFSWLACTVTVFNIRHIPDFLRWKVLESGFKKINSTKRRPLISHHMAHNPKHLNIRVLSPSQKESIQKLYSEALLEFANEFDELHFLEAKKILNGIEKYMLADSYFKSHHQVFLKQTEKLDQVRGQDGSHLLP